ncbi:hypothetical protein [Allorhizobium terrae]|uniref:Uncharacterized protein n=1 Tax=Allorhizobium terrae TaxID=1848972 RepID=A0A4S4A2T6_9HYPH|nr:hypothetical protein [Allorhizobium terrae]THF52565.1 hypothetical protein E6C51_07230 [Allorhizobium terrae]
MLSGIKHFTLWRVGDYGGIDTVDLALNEAQLLPSFFSFPGFCLGGVLGSGGILSMRLKTSSPFSWSGFLSVSGMDDPTKEHFRSIHEAFGLALTEWTSVELFSFQLYLGFMYGAQKAMISASWHNIQSFDAKIMLLDRCAAIAFEDDTLKNEWKPIYKDLKEFSLIRNAIVHSIILMRFESDGSFSTFYSNSIVDVTAKIKGRLNNPKYEFTEERLKKLADDFESLASKIKALAIKHFPHAKIDTAY